MKDLNCNEMCNSRDREHLEDVRETMKDEQHDQKETDMT
jgi:hypothetical protein